MNESGRLWYENKNNPEAFIKYFLGIMLAAYRDFEERLVLVTAKLPALEIVRRAIKMKIGKFTKNDIMEFCPGLSRTSVEKSLSKLAEEKVIERYGTARTAFYVWNGEG